MKIFQRNLPTRPCTVLLLMVNGSWRQLRRLKREDFFLVGVTEEAHVTRKHCLSFRLAAILGYQFVSCNSIHTEREWYFQRKYGTRTSFKEGTHFTSSQPSQQGGHCKGRAQYMIMKSLLRRMKCLTLQLLYEGVLHSSTVLQCSETSQAWDPQRLVFCTHAKNPWILVDSVACLGCAHVWGSNMETSAGCRSNPKSTNFRHSLLMSHTESICREICRI